MYYTIKYIHIYIYIQHNIIILTISAVVIKVVSNENLIGFIFQPTTSYPRNHRLLAVL